MEIVWAGAVMNIFTSSNQKFGVKFSLGFKSDPYLNNDALG